MSIVVLSDLISRLEQIKAQYGDIMITLTSCDGKYDTSICLNPIEVDSDEISTSSNPGIFLLPGQTKTCVISRNPLPEYYKRF